MISFIPTDRCGGAGPLSPPDIFEGGIRRRHEAMPSVAAPMRERPEDIVLLKTTFLHPGATVRIRPPSSKTALQEVNLYGST